ncbi:MAG: NfeD family protein [Acidobacteriota bacterium]
MFELTNAAWWWSGAGLLVILELMTGTFYLLMLALGAVAAAMSAHLHWPVTAQVAAAAVVGGGTVAAWHLYRTRWMHHSEETLSLDIGAQVQVDAWADDGTARVQYRGAAWTASYVGAPPAQPGRHVIKGIKGTRLMLDR